MHKSTNMQWEEEPDIPRVIIAGNREFKIHLGKVKWTWLIITILKFNTRQRG